MELPFQLRKLRKEQQITLKRADVKIRAEINKLESRNAIKRINKSKVGYLKRLMKLTNFCLRPMKRIG